MTPRFAGSENAVEDPRAGEVLYTHRGIAVRSGSFVSTGEYFSRVLGCRREPGSGGTSRVTGVFGACGNALQGVVRAGRLRGDQAHGQVPDLRQCQGHHGFKRSAPRNPDDFKEWQRATRPRPFRHPFF